MRDWVIIIAVSAGVAACGDTQGSSTSDSATSSGADGSDESVGVDDGGTTGDETGTPGETGSDDDGPVPDGEPVVSVWLTSSSAASDVPVTFGQIFAPGDLPSGRTLLGQLEGVDVPLQVDAKATHADGSLRHAVVSVIAPALAGGERTELVLIAASEGVQGDPPALGDLSDVAVTVDVGGDAFSGSFADADAQPWLDGPLVQEAGGRMALQSGGGEHPHLSARVDVRRYETGAAWVSVTVENVWTFAAAPANYTYDVEVSAPDGSALLSAASVPHYRQGRWRRAFWLGNDADVHVEHDRDYLVDAGAVPRYDPALSIPESVLADMQSQWSGPATELMGTGLIYEYMPGGGGRPDIGPLPRWTARYLISQDPRAKRSTLGTGEQAGSWPIHYRDRATDLPLSIDDYPDATILGSELIFPDCAGECSSPYEPDVAHQPSLAYVPYLVTGERFFLEELWFWANYNMFYWGNHGGSDGLVVYDQLRAQAWGLRTIAHAAYITPDDDPMRAYFEDKVATNLAFYHQVYAESDPNPFGHAQPRETGEGYIAFWMDDFFTWMLGHLTELGFEDAEPILAFKGRFPVGRISEPDYCFIAAPAYWCTVTDASGNSLFADWGELYNHVVAVDPETLTDSMESAIRADVDAFLAAECGSEQMGQLMGGWPAGTTINYPQNPESYSMNLVAALAAAVDAGVEGADEAWALYDTRTNDYWPPLEDSPQFAIYPRTYD